MGGLQCCDEKEVNSHQIVLYTQQKEIGGLAVNYRRQQPSQQLAIKMEDLANQYKDSKDWAYIQEKVRNMKNMEKIKLKSIPIDIPQIHNNFIDYHYYLKELRCFYIGQWVWNSKLNNNVPQGIGKLYEDQWISEGSIKTFVLGEEEQSFFQKNQASNFLTIKILPENDIKFSNKIIQVKLDGMGRKYNKNQQLVGKFVRGQLNGKGTYRIKNCKYQYVGQWVNGQKYGKGIEKTQQTQYEGTFQNNKKNGKGKLQFKISKEHQKLRIQQFQAAEKQIKQNIQGLGQVIKFKLAKQLLINQILQEYLKDFHWKPSFNLQTKFQDFNFLYQHISKKNYIQNYVGEFLDNQMHGYGIYTWFNGKVYHGQFVNGKMEGQGQFFWSNGSIYRGQYKDDMKHGKGEIIWSWKRRYRGNWAFGVRHGYGQLIIIDGKDITIKGSLWQQDKEIKMFFKQKITVEKLLNVPQSSGISQEQKNIPKSQ